MITRTIPYIPGDGVGPEVTTSMRRILDAAIARAYGGNRRLDWLEVAAGQKAFDTLGTYLPDGEAAQTPAPTTSKQGLGREA